MEEPKSILHELYVYSEWKPEPEYIQKPDGLLPENISALWRWIKFLGPKKSLIDSVTAHKERQQKWHIALGDEGKVIAVLTDNILEIRTKRSDYATIAARTTVSRDAYSQWRKLAWSPDCAFLVLAYGNGVVSFFDLTASNLFNIPIDCSRPGGLECTDNTHAVVDIIFMPLRVKDTKWSWEVLIVNYDGKVRGYLVSQMDGFTLHHTTKFSGGIGSVAYCDLHASLYVAGMPRSHKDPNSAHSTGITAWRVINDEPYYKLSVVSDQLEAQASEKFQFYIPFITSKNLAFIIQMALSPDSSKLVCLHCNGEISVWRLPLLKLLYRYPLPTQPGHDLKNPLTPEETITKDLVQFYPADVNWWNNEEVIVSRFSGAVSVCHIRDLVNRLGHQPEFFQGAPRVTRAFEGTCVALECETKVVPARSSSDDSLEVSAVEESGGAWDTCRELVKWALFALTDIESLQPRPRRVLCLARVYRLLALKSTTPTELFSRKIESGKYSEALTLASTFGLDSDLVYQQQWRKNPVSTDAIDKYLSKVSKKIWAVHQCVDRLPETLPAAKELLQFGLQLTDENILEEINKDRPEDEQITSGSEIMPEHLNAYTSELLRCRHVMLFYKERLWLYESILKYEKSSYVKDEYDRLRSNSIMRSSMEIAKEGRIEALTCLWPHIKTTAMKLAVLDKLPETINPLDYQHLLPTKAPAQWFETKSPIKIPQTRYEHDWCRKQIFRSIWSSNWSEETTPDSEATYDISESDDVTKWYEKRAREIEERSGLVSHALNMTSLATVGGGVEGLQNIMFHLQTLDTLVYDINLEGITLKQLEEMTPMETCAVLMKNSSIDLPNSKSIPLTVEEFPSTETILAGVSEFHYKSTEKTFVSDLKSYVVPFLKRYETLSRRPDACLCTLLDYLESISVDDLAPILLLLQSPMEYKLDVRTHLELAERCLLAHSSTDQLDLACDLLATILTESDGTISPTELVRRVGDLERLVAGSGKLAWRGVCAAPRDLKDTRTDPKHAAALLTRLARSVALGDVKPTQADWEKLLRDILELQATLFNCVTKEQCYEIYASSLLTSGDLSSIRLAGGVLSVSATAVPVNTQVSYTRAVQLVSNAANEYVNSASSLTDQALELAKCCLTLINDGNPVIQQELDLIASFQILHSFNLNILPIQVRLCEDKMSLIEDCLKSDPNAFLACHKLLKLATLLRIAPGDDIARESKVVQLVGTYAAAAGEGGCGAAVAAARRLASLRARAAPLLAAVARTAHAHADRNTRRHLLAAALVSCDPDNIEDLLKDRLSLELEGLQQMGVTLKDTKPHLSERCPSTDDEFADAITTPVIEKKDLVAPAHTEKKVPVINYLLNTFQNKLSLGDASTMSTETDKISETARTPHVPTFYRAIYPEHGSSESSYSYRQFSTPGPALAHQVLHCYYVQNSLADSHAHLETEVVQKCAEELLYKDSPLSVACMLHTSHSAESTRRFLDTHHSETAVGCALYATLVHCNRAELADNVYLTKPKLMAETTLKKHNATEEQLRLIEQCIARLSGMAEVEALRKLGFSVSPLLFNADRDYRLQVIYNVAGSPTKEHLETALQLAHKYSVDATEVWLRHAAAAPRAPHLTLASLPHTTPRTHARILESLYPQIEGSDHAALIQLFTLLKGVDDKPLIHGLTATDHIKQLKKARAASHELDYKLLIEQPSAEQLTSHLLAIIKPENIGTIGKFLRSLPPAIKLPVTVHGIYNKWLVKYFFGISPSQESSKKWMQQYRQCASYFSKLPQQELLSFFKETCFSEQAIRRVPHGTRGLMIAQGVDYCHQEHENEFKFHNTDRSWADVGEELSRWGQFLETFHSPPVQAIIQHSNVPPHDDIWLQLEMSVGEAALMAEAAARLVVRPSAAPGTLPALLRVWPRPTLADTLLRVARHCLHTHQDVETLITRLNAYNKEGLSIPPEVLSEVLFRAELLSLPPQQHISLLALAGEQRGDMKQCAQYSLDLFRTEWPDDPYVEGLTEEKLQSECGRRAAFYILLDKCDSLHRRKALVDVLACWPPVREEGEARSLHCEFLSRLLAEAELKHEALLYIKMLLRQPLLTEEEVKWLAETVSAESAINVVWIILLNNCPSARDEIVKLLQLHRETIQRQEIEDTLIKELLDFKMLIPLVPTVLYPSVVNYIVGQTNMDENTDDIVYDVIWATSELIQANYLAEAGHIYLMTAGVPAALRGFSDTVKFCKNMLMFEQ